MDAGQRSSGAMTPLTLNLPTAGGGLSAYTIKETPIVAEAARGKMNRVAYAAAHIVADPFADIDPWEGAAVNWDRTVAFREHLWSLGLGVAEAMDTAQRGMGLDWAGAQQLIRRMADAARGRDDALIAYGAGTDHLAPGPAVTLEDVIGAYEAQVGFVEGLGGRVILMAS